MSHPPARTHPITSITQVDSDKSSKLRDLFKLERMSLFQLLRSHSHTELSQPSLKGRAEQSQQSNLEPE
jgi:hypothetical protein